MSKAVNSLVEEFRKEIARATDTLELSKKSYDYYREAFEGAREDYENAERYLSYLEDSLKDIRTLEADLYG